MRKFILNLHFEGLVVLILFFMCIDISSQQLIDFKYHPEVYICQKLSQNDMIEIDGIISEHGWEVARKISRLYDIEGATKNPPWFNTEIRMVWNDQFLYVAAELEEPNLWATYDNRDMIIFHENDFEIFLDPDRDTHHYGEIEINALGTIWDLLLTKPYRDNGKPIDTWDIQAMLVAVKKTGTLNIPSDTDEKWAIEMAIPWSALEELNVHTGPPHHGEAWKVNFSRVEWQLDTVGNTYVKRRDSITQKSLSEHNWVWSIQGAIAMHQPETWGLLLFSDTMQDETFFMQNALNLDDIYWKLRQGYYWQKAYFKANGRYAESVDIALQPLQVAVGMVTFTLTYCTNGQCHHINEEGRVWTTQSSL